MKKINTKRRFFFKSTSFFFYTLFAVKNYKIVLFKNLKSNLLKFVKKNKKIWILSKNDFK